MKECCRRGGFHRAARGFCAARWRRRYVRLSSSGVLCRGSWRRLSPGQPPRRLSGVGVLHASSAATATPICFSPGPRTNAAPTQARQDHPRGRSAARAPRRSRPQVAHRTRALVTTPPASVSPNAGLNFIDRSLASPSNGPRACRSRRCNSRRIDYSAPRRRSPGAPTTSRSPSLQAFDHLGHLLRDRFHRSLRDSQAHTSCSATEHLRDHPCRTVTWDVGCVAGTALLRLNPWPGRRASPAVRRRSRAAGCTSPPVRRGPARRS